MLHSRDRSRHNHSGREGDATPDGIVDRDDCSNEGSLCPAGVERLGRKTWQRGCPTHGRLEKVIKDLEEYSKVIGHFPSEYFWFVSR